MMMPYDWLSYGFKKWKWKSRFSINYSGFFPFFRMKGAPL